MTERIIYKYPLVVYDTCIPLPKGAIPLYVGIQNGAPMVWASIDPTAPLVKRLFCVRATGEPVESGLTYLGTIIDGRFVWHIHYGDEE